jgi:zinc ribbon protein
MPMQCPACQKQIPTDDRFCAYCGAPQGRRLLPGLTLRLPSIPVRWLPIAIAGAVLGGMGGALLGSVVGGPWFGLVSGAVGIGASAALGEVVAGAVPDRRSAERFGQALGALGGALVFPGAILAALLITAWYGAPHTLTEFVVLLSGGFYLSLPSAIGGALIGILVGFGLGRLSGRAGYTLLRRRGAILGAAVAWTLAGALGGLFTGDFAGRLAGAPRLQSAAIGVGVQILLGALALIPLGSLHRLWRGWRKRRP